MSENNSVNNFGEMLDELKVRLGFGKSSAQSDGYEHYDDYDDGGADYSDARGARDGRGANDAYAGYDDYDDYDDYDRGAPVGGFKPATPYSSRQSRFDRNNISSSLVSIDDVKAATPLPDRYGYDSPSQTTPSYQPAASAFGDSTVGQTFEPVSAEAAPAVAPSGQVTYASTGAASGAAYDPYAAFSGASTSTYQPVRTLTVIKPTSYSDAEGVARAVRSGDVAVLVMRDTSDELSKRILDFSFGVASALGASVECPAEKIFAIANGSGLTDAEKMRLRGQGVL